MFQFQNFHNVGNTALDLILDTSIEWAVILKMSIHNWAMGNDDGKHSC
jgi:hypothetical protein